MQPLMKFLAKPKLDEICVTTLMVIMFGHFDKGASLCLIYLVYKKSDAFEVLWPSTIDILERKFV